MKSLPFIFQVYNFRILERSSFALIGAGFLLQLSLVFVSQESLAHRPFEEDSFYIMSITRSLARGDSNLITGPMVIGGMQPGGLVYTVAHLLADFDPSGTLRWARLIGLLGSCLSAFLIFRVCRLALEGLEPYVSRPLSLLSAGIWMVSFQAYRINLNGYETVFAVCAMLLAVECFVRRWRAGINEWLRWDVVTGTSIGLMILGRVDLGLLAASLAVWFFLFYPGSFGRRFRSVAVWVTCALLATVPWWYVNWVIGSSMMPLSGMATQLQLTFYGYWHTTLSNIGQMMQSLEEMPFMSVYAPYEWHRSLLLHAVRLAAVGGVSIMLFANRGQFEFLKREVHWAPWGAVFLFVVVMVLYYSLFHAASWHIRRYVHPIRALFFCWSGLYVILVASSLTTWVKKQSITQPVTYALIGCVAFVSIVQHSMTFNKTGSNAFMPAVFFLQNNYPEAHVGAFQSGTFGYFLRKVTNLDGKVNPLALRAAKRGTILEYIDEAGVDLICDWSSIIFMYCDSTRFVESFEKVTDVGSVSIWRRRGSFGVISPGSGGAAFSSLIRSYSYTFIQRGVDR